MQEQEEEEEEGCGRWRRRRRRRRDVEVVVVDNCGSKRERMVSWCLYCGDRSRGTSWGLGGGRDKREGGERKVEEF